MIDVKIINGSDVQTSTKQWIMFIEPFSIPVVYPQSYELEIISTEKIFDAVTGNKYFIPIGTQFRFNPDGDLASGQLIMVQADYPDEFKGLSLFHKVISAVTVSELPFVNSGNTISLDRTYIYVPKMCAVTINSDVAAKEVTIYEDPDGTNPSYTKWMQTGGNNPISLFPVRYYPHLYRVDGLRDYWNADIRLTFTFIQ